MHFSRELIDSSYTYTSYKNLVINLWNDGKSTGPIQNEELLHYTEMNIHRMNRVEKTNTVSTDLKTTLNKIVTNQIWLIIAEGWCGDAAQIVPIFHLIENEFPQIKVKLLLRDENLALMDQFLTNGSRSIPKLLIIDGNTYNLLSQWGPRPNEAQNLINQMKADKHDMLAIKEKLHLWYAKNKGFAVQNELNEILNKLLNS
jgi:hypothetical protein